MGCSGVNHSRITRQGLFASSPSGFRAFCCAGSVRRRRTAQPRGSQLIPQIEFSPPAIFNRSKEAETAEAAGSQLAMAAASGNDHHIRFEDVQGRRARLAASGAEPVPQGVEARATHLHAARATASGAVARASKTGAVLLLRAAIWAPPPTQRLGLPRSRRRSGDGEGPAERRAASQQPQGLPAGDANTRLLWPTARQISSQGPGPAFRRHNNRAPSPVAAPRGVPRQGGTAL